MKSILVVVDGTDASPHLLEAAIGRAEREGSSLVVATVIEPREYAVRRRSIASTAALRQDGFTYTLDQAQADAAALATRAARAAVGSRDVPYVAVGAVGPPARAIRAVATAHDCATIVVAEEASWWRRRLNRLGRDLARGFDGDVVRIPQSPPEPEVSLPDAEPLTR